jgi:hypothetical protein
LTIDLMVRCFSMVLFDCYFQSTFLVHSANYTPSGRTHGFCGRINLFPPITARCENPRPAPGTEAFPVADA